MPYQELLNNSIDLVIPSWDSLLGDFYCSREVEETAKRLWNSEKDFNKICSLGIIGRMYVVMTRNMAKDMRRRRVITERQFLFYNDFAKMVNNTPDHELNQIRKQIKKGSDIAYFLHGIIYERINKLEGMQKTLESHKGFSENIVMIGATRDNHKSPILVEENLYTMLSLDKMHPRSVYLTRYAVLYNKVIRLRELVESFLYVIQKTSMHKGLRERVDWLDAKFKRISVTHIKHLIRPLPYNGEITLKIPDSWWTTEAR